MTKEYDSLYRNGSAKTRVGTYELGRTIGKGTFATVKLAKHIASGSEFAIKILEKETIRKHNMFELTKREISTMKRLRHPHIVRLYEVMASKAKVYFVLEYANGGQFFDKIRQYGRLPETEARKFFQQLINAVDYCHSQGVYHRDLKPENLLLDADGNLKISDFGLSGLAEERWNDGLLRTTCGTPGYVAPEVFYQNKYDGAKSDVWSCGVILFEFMAGFLPFEDENIMRLYMKIRRGGFECPPWFSSGAVNFIKNILNPAAKQRYSISEILEDPWFKEGYDLQKLTIIKNIDVEDVDANCRESNAVCTVEEKRNNTKVPGPTLLNAFDLISSSPDLNLSGLFELKEVDQETRFTSKYPADEIILKIEETAKPLGFSVEKHDYKMRLHGARIGTKRHLSVATEVFEVAPSFFMVEVRKACGDALEYRKFCESFSLGLKEIVWQREAMMVDDTGG